MTAPHALGGEEEFSELTDAQIDRVDLVGVPANGRAFLLRKAAEDGLLKPLIAPEQVADLLAKAEDSTATINDLPDSDFAYIEDGGHKDDSGRTVPRSLRHFPIQDAAHVRNALARAPQSPFGEKAMPKIRRAAEKFGVHVSKSETDTDPAADVAKDAPPIEVDDITADAPAGGTAESLPGSPDWETLDGDTAMAAVAVLGRVKAVLCWLADREAQEAVTADPDDAQSAADLSCMADQVDCLIAALAGFAAGEHLEAGMADELDAVGKAVADVAAPLAVIEGLAPVAKAGRVLSAANEQRIRQAVESLTGVLNSLPQAPAADDVTKTEEQPVPEPTAPETAAEPVDVLAKALAALPRLDAPAVAAALLAGGRTQDVAKAKGDPQLAVFDQNGKLIGTVDPSDLSPIASSADEAKDAGADVADDKTADGGDQAPPPDAPAAETPPADDAARVVPGTDTVQAPPQPPDDDKAPAVAKTAADRTTLEEVRTPLVEELRKYAELADVVKALQERVEKMAKLPDDRRSPVLNGGTGQPGAVTRDGADPGGLDELRKQIDAETDPVKKAERSKAAFFAEVKARFQQ